MLFAWICCVLSHTSPSVYADGPAVLTINGGTYLYSYHPFVTERKPTVELYLIWLTFDSSIPTDVFRGAKEQFLGIHIEPRYSNSRLKPPPLGAFWGEEAYGYYKNSWSIFKVGQTYAKFGRFLESSYYGTLQFFNGIRQEPDDGLSYEVAIPTGYGFIMGGAVQYFLIDGFTNSALPNRDLVWIKDAHKRNIFGIRLEPSYRFEEDELVTLGISAQHFKTDIPNSAQGGPVNRYALNLALTTENLQVFTEHIRQFGYTTNDFPFPGVGSNDNRYLLFGAKYKIWGKIIPQYYFSWANYHDQNVLEYINAPGIEWIVQRNLSLNAVFGHWRRKNGDQASIVDRSILIGLLGTF